MSSVKDKIFGFLKGEFLVNQEALKNWRMVIFIIFLLMLMVRSSHITDEKVLKIAKLSKQERELRAEYIALRSQAMKLKLESNIEKKVKDLGLYPSKEPVHIIKEIKTNN